jgi:hypothetical protein
MDAFADPVHDRSTSTKHRSLTSWILAFRSDANLLNYCDKVEVSDVRLGGGSAKQMLWKPIHRCIKKKEAAIFPGQNNDSLLPETTARQSASYNNRGAPYMIYFTPK